MNEEKIIANQLAKNLGRPTYESKSGSPLFFDQFSIADRFADLFGIVDNEDKVKFRETFLIATEGQGGEINKINSIVSSALLPLLVFFRLFGEANNKYTITINREELGNVVFDKCFFEVRNRVIKLPSCVDVALYSSSEKILLFLESKFTEIFSIDNEKAYGKGYIDLYDNKLLQDAISSNIKVESTADNLVLKSDKKCYIEGIKQTISHLIGLVRGPKTYDKYPEGYPEKYAAKYLNTFKESSLYYGTLLFNTDSLIEDTSACGDYSSLYSDTIGAHGPDIINAIKEWDGNEDNKKREIIVLKEPLTYQGLFSNAHNQALLIEKVRTFYQL